MTRALPFTKATVRRAIALAREAGLTVTGIAPDGTVLTAGDNPAARVPAAGGDMQTDPFVIAARRAHGAKTRKRYRATS